MFDVIWVAGERDGELLSTFDFVHEAQDFAVEYYRKHEQEFDLLCGGVAIIDTESGEEIIDW